MLWFLPAQNGLQPASRRTVAIDAHSRGMCELYPGKPVEVSEIEANPFWWWLRPVRKTERGGGVWARVGGGGGGGAPRAVVRRGGGVGLWAGSRSMVGISTRPPYGDQA